MTFIDNLIRNDSQKRQKRHKRHILALCFPRARVEHARVARQTTSHDSIQPMIYLQTIITFSSELKSSKYVQLTRVKNYIQELLLNTIFKQNLNI